MVYRVAMVARPPTDRRPDGLDVDHVQIVARLLAETRDAAQAQAQPGEGDNATVIGFQSWTRSCFKIREQERLVDWLTVIDASANFTFLIDGRPVRFFHGDAEASLASRRLATHTEFRVCQRYLFDVPTLARFVIETDSAGYAARVLLRTYTFDGAPTGDAFVCWTAPDDSTRSGIRRTSTPPRESHSREIAETPSQADG